LNYVEVDKQEAAQAKVISIFSYIGLLFLVPLIAGKENKFAQYHANQGLVLFIASFAIGFATKILAFVAPLLSMAISGVSGIVILVFAILGIINVCQLEAKPLPIIGGITLIKSY